MTYYFNARLWGVTPYKNEPPIDTLYLKGRPANESFQPETDYYIVTSPLNGSCPDTWLVEKEYFDSNFIKATEEQVAEAMKELVCLKTS